MASEKGPVATEAPLAAPVAPQSTAAAAAAAIGAAELFASEPGRAGSLKRPREVTPTSPVSAGAAQANPDLSPSKVQRLGLASRHSPAPLTGALADEEDRIRRTEEARQAAGISDNPSHRVLDVLMSATVAMSRAQDAPEPDPAAVPTASSDDASKPISEAVAPAPNTLPKPEPPSEQSTESAPTSQALEGAQTQVVDSPAPMDVEQRSDQSQGPLVAQPEAQTQEKNTAYSYPGILPPSVSMVAPAPPQRGMSLPMTSSQHPDIVPRSPSSKKHKCPCCDTEFTRHHNLKSHLLTHSQEKPYACNTCQMRFRRLHDLKRHSKLHTGEKPHICPKCDRKFARGDALARHAKGAGGCAGRRASMGSFGGEEFDDSAMHEGDSSAMTGVLYETNEADMTEEDRRRLSLSVGAKNPHVATAAAPDDFGNHARAYPPTVARQGTSGAITESPKALSPGSALAAQLGHESSQLSASSQRSPSTTAQLAQAYSRRQDQAPQSGPAPITRTVPPPGGVNHQTAAGAHSRASSGVSHGQNGTGDSSANLFASGDDGIWTYLHSVDTKWEAAIKQALERVANLETAKAGSEAQTLYLQEKVTQLTDEVSFLRQQVTALRNEFAARHVDVEAQQPQQPEQEPEPEPSQPEQQPEPPQPAAEAEPVKE